MSGFSLIAVDDSAHALPETAHTGATIQSAGQQGPPGRSVESIARTSGTGAPGTLDTYTITYSDSDTTTFQIYNGTNGTNGTNGRGITSIARTSGTGAAGTTDTYTITFTDSTTSTFNVVNGANGTAGRGIASIARTAGTGAPGTTDTYTITYTDATTTTFQVANGANGAGSGDVIGPASSADNRVALFNGTTGKAIKDSGVTLGTAATKNTGTGAGQIPVLSGAPGTPDGTKFLRDDGTWAAAGGSGAGSLLTHTFYSATDKSVTSTTIVDIDATNLAVTFTAPPSGAVIVRLTGYTLFQSGAGTLHWGLRSGAATVVEGEVTRGGFHGSHSKAFKITGLTAGNSYTFKWSWRVSTGTVSLQCLTGGGALMEVISA